MLAKSRMSRDKCSCGPGLLFSLYHGNPAISLAFLLPTFGARERLPSVLPKFEKKT